MKKVLKRLAAVGTISHNCEMCLLEDLPIFIQLYKSELLQQQWAKTIFASILGKHEMP